MASKKTFFFVIGSILLVGIFLSWGKNISQKQPTDAGPTSKLNASILALPNDQPSPSLTPAVSKPSLIPAASVLPTEKSILLDVPFAAQAPFGEWDDPIFQDGCEEASVLVAMSWVNGKKNLTKDEVRNSIINISNFEDITYGHAPDRSAVDTVRLLEDYFDYRSARVEYGIGASEIKSQLFQGNLIIVPVNGQKLKNAFYTPPGPERHMLVIIGYDAKTNEFITNDVGTRHGEKYRYPENTLTNALRDYPTGAHLPITDPVKAMIIIQPTE